MAANSERGSRRPGEQSPSVGSGAGSKREGETVPNRGAVVDLPEQFGRYRIQKKLGGGGMGAVYLAHDTELDREVALKVPHFSDGDPEVRERFLREARSAAKLDHANLCPVFDVGVLDGVYYLTMRYLKGVLLSTYAGVPQPPRKVVEVVAKLAQALEAAHRSGVIHRDLKPDNIMMCGSTGPVVMDFGLAKQTKQQDQMLTQAGTMMGTPAYMPPEQVQGQLERIGPRSDIYTLGVIFFQLLTGRLPFEGTTAEVFGKILYTEASRPSQVRPGLNPTLDAICGKATAKAPEQRYASMKLFAAALIDYLKATPATEGAGSLIAKTPAGAVNRDQVLAAPTMAPGAARPKNQADIHAAQTVAPGAVGPKNRADVLAAQTVAPGRSAAGGKATRPTAESPVHLGERIPPSVPELPESARRNREPVRKSGSPRRGLLIAAGVAAAALLLVVLGVILLRVETPEGTVVLEIDQAAAKVYVNGREIDVHVSGEKKPIKIKVVAGEHTLRVEKDGFETVTREFSYRKGEDAVVKVRMEPKKPAAEGGGAKPPKPDEEKGAPVDQGRVDKRFVSPVKPILKGGRPAEDPFQSKSVWVNDERRQHLTVIERKGERFTAIFKIGNVIVRDVTGTVKDGKVWWLGRDVRPIKGKAGDDNYGTITRDNVGCLLDFVWRKDGRDLGTFVLRLQPNTAANAFRSLFNGKDLTGWSVDSGAAERWEVEEGYIKGTGVGSGGRGWLLSAKEYENFILTLEFQAAAQADGAVGIRARSGEKVGGLPHHLAIKLTGYTNPRLPRVGAFYYWGNVWQQPSKQAKVAPEGEWNSLTVQVQGEELQISVNGEDVQNLRLGEFAKKKNVFPGVKRSSGRIGLQQHTGEIRFRKIEIKELPATKKEP